MTKKTLIVGSGFMGTSIALALNSDNLSCVEKNANYYDSLKKISMLPKDTYIYCAHEYTKSNLQWALTINPNDKFLKKKLLEVEKILFEKRSTIPSILEEEMKINLFLRAENLQEFKYLRNNKDSWV